MDMTDVMCGCAAIDHQGHIDMMSRRMRRASAASLHAQLDRIADASQREVTSE
jgi:hypothetical protein